MQILVPKAVEQIIEELTLHGYEAYAVGGCVRDTLLGRVPGDWDITTSAQPDQVKGIFKRTIDTGIQHGTVTVMVNHTGYEVTTYRVDGEYEDGRHPKSVEFTSDLLEDLKRRDFTINAMAYSHSAGIVDAFGGIDDLNHGIIRCVGNPEDRFREDALRILRAIRFSAQLGFNIDEGTSDAIKTMAPNIAQVSKERIQAELTKILLSAHPDKMGIVFDFGIGSYLSPSFRAADHVIQINPLLEEKKYLRWAAFLQKVSEPSLTAILKELKMDNDTLTKVSALVRWLVYPVPQEKAGIRRLMSQMPAALYDDLLILKRSAMPPVQAPEQLSVCEKLSREIREQGDCVSLKSLAVNGSDLIAAGMSPGKKIGDMLQQLFDIVLEHPEFNLKEYLIDQIRI